MRVCAEPGCPTLIQTGTRDGRCARHRRAKDKARGSSTARGYDYTHQLERKAWAIKVRAGRVLCRRCDKPIDPAEPWDLGHPDADCPKPKAPEHRACNRATAGR